MSISAQCLSVSPATMPEVLALANDSLPGLALAYSISSLTGLGRHARMHHQHQREASHPRHRREVLHRVVAHVLHQERDGRKRRVGRHQQRVAVRRGVRGVECGQRAVRARAVLDDDGLLERDAERLGDHAADRVAGAAGAEHGDEGDRLARIVVGAQRRAEQCRRRRPRECRSSFFMRGSSLAVANVCSSARRFAWARALPSCAIRRIADLRSRGMAAGWVRLSQPFHRPQRGQRVRRLKLPLN